MTRANIGSVALLVMVSACAVGCSVDCEAVCERKEESGCPFLLAPNLDPNTPPREPGCAAFCEEMNAKAEAGGCKSEFDEYLSCIDDRDNVCNDRGCSFKGSPFCFSDRQN